MTRAYSHRSGPPAHGEACPRDRNSALSGQRIRVGHADKAHWIRVGRACQRFALTATSLGLKHAYVNQPVEVARLRPELAALVGAQDKRPDIVMRFGYGPTMPYAPRRPVDSVIA
jgi:hypothetical protein